MNQVPTKIVLKSTTRMSLNDRFSNIVPNVQSMRANMAAEHQVSTANRRLAQQLSNRPGISHNQAANMMMYNNNNNNNNNMMMRQQGRGRRGTPLQQRVGRGNVKARLSLPNNNNFRGGMQTPRGRGGRGGNQMGARGGNQMGAGGDNYGSWTMTTQFKPRGRGALPTRSPRGRGTFRGGRGQQFNRDLNDSTRNTVGDRGASRYRGRRRPQYQGPYSDRFTGQAIRGGVRGRGRGAMATGGFTNQRGGAMTTVRGRGGFVQRGRGFNRGGRGGAFRGGRGGPGGNNKGSTSVADLDSQLDQYMSKSKSSLDSELDAYMAQTTD